ncbi:MAG: hypothetical protein QOE03_2924, partial [Micromonosporaceae bacterium]|nr:hypothetical protein [Micromonosporaceae bacterium]
MTQRGYDGEMTGPDDDPAHSLDYDGGLRAVSEGGRVAVLQGGGARPANPTGETPLDEVDSPFLGLVDDSTRGTAPA